MINVKTTERNGKVVGIAQVTEKSEVMLISQYGKIIRIDSNSIRESGPLRARRAPAEHRSRETGWRRQWSFRRMKSRRTADADSVTLIQ